MKKLVLFMALCLCLPVLALAVTEGVVEEAAAVDVSVALGAQEESYLPDPSYYAGYGDYEPEWGASESYVQPEWQGDCFGPSAQDPCLTSGEVVRAKKLLAAYQKGEAKGDGSAVLNVTENVTLGVYPLNPEDYDGEAVFVILPNISLTDEQMLALIDAYDQLGLTFDPEGLSYRNCMRGGGIECTRFYTDEEQERRTTLRSLIRRGKLTGVEAEDVLRVELDARYFNGLDGFSFRPYRRMTDEEMASQLVALGVHDESAEMDFDGVEKYTRQLLTNAFDCPLSMTLETISSEGAYLPHTLGENGAERYAAEQRSAIYTAYRYPKAGMEYVLATVMLDVETGRVVEMSLTDIPLGWEQVETPRDPAVPDEAYFAAATAFVRERMGAYVGNPDALVWQMHEQDEWWTNYGLSVCVTTRLPDTGEMLTVFVGCADMQVHNVRIQADQKDWFEGVEFETDDMPMNG